MRLIVSIIVLALGACSSEAEPQRQTGQSGAAAPAPAAAAAVSTKSPLMAIPDDPEALKRLEAMGYTIHAEQGHLHAPGVNSCPAMGDSAVM